MAEHAYVVTAHKASSVTLSCRGNFTAHDVLNLVVAKNTRLEVYVISDEGLAPYIDFNLFGCVSWMKFYRCPTEKQDRLFLCMQSFNFLVLYFNSETGEIETKASGDLKCKGDRPSETVLGEIDPLSRCIGLHLYEGWVQIIKMTNQGNLKQEATNFYLKEPCDIISMCFISIPNLAPVLALIVQNSSDQRVLKFCTVNFETKSLDNGPWPNTQLPNGAMFVTPVENPIGGVLVIGYESILYYGGPKARFSTVMHPKMVSCFEKLDKERYLIGSEDGQVLLCALDCQGPEVKKIVIEQLGITSPPKSISYLDNSYVYIGSATGDSQLIRLTENKDENGSYIENLENYTNLGPIVDLCVMDLDRQGQGQVVSCSGTFSQGTLRVIRNGIAINQLASVEMEGVKGMWPLRDSFETEYEKYLVQSFVGETRILGMSEEQLGEVEVEGFENLSQTLFCTNMIHDMIVQITQSNVRLISCQNLELVFEWKPDNCSISVAHANASQVILATSDKKVILLEIDSDKKLSQISNVNVDCEVACLDISIIGLPDDKGDKDKEGAMKSGYAVLGFWDYTVRIISLPSLKEIVCEKLDSSVIPRSVMMVRMAKIPYVLIGLGDGHLINYILEENPIKFTNRKKISLGSQPILLSPFVSKNVESVNPKGEMEVDDEANDDVKMQSHSSFSNVRVFASCDRPTIIYSGIMGKSKGKLMYSNVNIKDVTCMASFNCEDFPGSLSFATESELLIGEVDDEIQRLHVRTIPLFEQPKRIVHQPSNQSLLVGTTKFDENLNEEHFLRLFDDQTFDCTHSFPLEKFENVSSAISARLILKKDESASRMEVEDETKGSENSENIKEYFVVGTAYVDHKKEEPEKGRILVLEVVERRLKLICFSFVKGAVYSLAEFHGQLLAGVNGTLLLLKWCQNEKKRCSTLNKVCEFKGSIIVLYLRALGDYIAIGDLMTSVKLVVFDAMTNSIAEVARDFEPAWLTSIEMVQKDLIIAADSNLNFFTLKRNLEAASEEDRSRLIRTGRFYYGDFVNQIRKGSLVMDMPDSENPIKPSHLFATVNGAIGVIAFITKEDFEFFSNLEKAIESLQKGVGGLKHSEFRKFRKTKTEEAASGFIDGDLIETFLELPKENMEEISKKMEFSVEEITNRVEEASRIR